MRRAESDVFTRNFTIVCDRYNLSPQARVIAWRSAYDKAHAVECYAAIVRSLRPVEEVTRNPVKVTTECRPARLRLHQKRKKRP